jgi:uncharacterized repeat protein (TIGR03943 family)
VLVLLTGVVTLRLAVTGAYTAYVRVGMFWVLVATGALLVLLGVSGLWRLRTPPGPEGDDGEHGTSEHGTGEPGISEHGTSGHGIGEHGHSHAGAPAVSLLLLLPLLVAYVVAPASLGAYSAQMSAGATLPEQRSGFAPLEPGADGVVDVRLAETVRRSVHDGASMQGARLRVVGFVVPSGAGGPGPAQRVLLTRFVIRCCAADGTPAQVDLALPPGGPALAADQWVEVVMTPADDTARAGGVARFTAESVRVVDPPDDPYET